MGSDFAKVDAYENTPADYDELPDLADLDPAKGFFQESGVPDLGRLPTGARDAPAQRRAQVTLRLDPAVLDAFKATGPGWQARINDVLARAAKQLGR